MSRNEDRYNRRVDLAVFAVQVVMIVAALTALIQWLCVLRGR